jgi:hypothetical protein
MDRLMALQLFGTGRAIIAAAPFAIGSVAAEQPYHMNLRDRASTGKDTA